MASLHSPKSYDENQHENPDRFGIGYQYSEDFFTEDSFHSFSNGLPTIYGVTSISDDVCTDSMLVALTKGNIMLYSVKKSGYSFVNADCCELVFKSLPTDCSFTAIDCMRFGAQDVAVALAFSKEAGGGKQLYTLNIYSKEISNNDLTNLNHMESCASFDLGAFPPFQITHCKTTLKNASDKSLVPVFLLLGGDCRIHVYSQNEEECDFSEGVIDEFFPEFKSISSAALWVDIKITACGKKRISALGKASGEVSICITDLTSADWMTTNYHIQCDSPITCVRLFSKFSSSPKPDFFATKLRFEAESVPQEPLHLLVTYAREPAVVYCYCAEQGFHFPVLLKQSSNYDCVTCCEIADINRDGKSNIIIGTYGNKILVYPFDIPGPPSNPDDCSCCPASLLPMWSKSICYPVIGIKFLDITGDGLKELVVVSAKGVHVMHCDVATAIDECIQKLEWLRKFGIR